MRLRAEDGWLWRRPGPGLDGTASLETWLMGSSTSWMPQQLCDVLVRQQPRHYSQLTEGFAHETASSTREPKKILTGHRMAVLTINFSAQCIALRQRYAPYYATTLCPQNIQWNATLWSRNLWHQGMSHVAPMLRRQRSRV